MKIAVVGGSNSITSYGWFPRFAGIAREAGSAVQTFALGACTSAYGVARVVTENLAERFDRIVFEFTLNDINYVHTGFYRVQEMRRNLDALLRIPGIADKLVFILIQPQQRWVWSSVRGRMALQTYRDIAAGYGLRCCDIAQFLERLSTQGKRYQDAFRDPAHIGEEVSQTVADRTWQLCLRPRPVENAALKPPAFNEHASGLPHIVSATEGAAVHTGEIWTWSNSFISKDLVRLTAGQTIHMPLKGRLVGVMARSEAPTGFGLLTSGAVSVVKNFYDSSSARMSPYYAMYLMQEPMPLDPEAGLTLKVGVTGQEIYLNRHDPSAVETFPVAEKSAQILNVGGFIVDAG